MEHHGTVFKTRFRKLQEQVRALKAIWTQDVAEFHGEFVNFDPIWSWPKPVQTPHPPVLWGGESDHTLRRVVELGDGWFPRARAGQRIFTGLATLRELAARAGRDPGAISVSVFGATEDAALLDRYRQAGITRAILRLPSEPREVILPLLDRYARLLG
jgi:alkanesulfonate monooxygenase SsuD/methylene tetrahydromethanopterin reductase-like flavin-dependent oxidoreductase (luciferase family)